MKYRLHFFLLCFVLIASAQLHAADRYWIATSSTTNKNWSNTANWSTTSGGSGGSSVPSTTDNVYFNGNGNGKCLIDVPASPGQINIDSTYTDSIKLGSTLTVNSTYTQNGGVLWASSYSITMKSSFTINKGTFRSTSYRLLCQGAVTIKANTATFLHNNGEVFFGGTLSISVPGTTSFYDCIISFISGLGNTITLNANTVITVDHSLTINAVNINGPGAINAHGDILQNGASVVNGGSATLNINGTGNQTFSGTGTIAAYNAGAVCNVNINKPAGTTLSFVKSVVIGGNWTNQNNTSINFGNSTIVFTGPKTISETQEFGNVSLYTPGYGATTTIPTGKPLKVNGTLSIGGSNQIIDGPPIEARGDITAISYGNISFNSGSSGILINGTVDQVFTGYDNSTIGFGIFHNITIDKPPGSALKINKLVTVNGTWTFNRGTIDMDYYPTSIIAFTNASTIAGNNHALKNVLFYAPTGAVITHTINASTTLTVTGDLTLQASGSGRLNINTGTIEAKGNINLIPGNGATTTSAGGTALIKINGDGNLQTITGPSSFQAQALLPHVEINKPNGNLNLSGFVTAGGNWNYIPGTGAIIPGTSTLAFAGSYTGTSSISGNQNLYDLMFSAPSGGNYTFNITSGTTLSVGRDLLITNAGGTIINTGTIAVARHVTYSNTSAYTGGSALININGTGDQTLTGSGTVGTGRLCNVAIAKTNGTLTLASIISVAGSWSFNPTLGGTLNAGTSTVVFNVGSRTISGSQSFYKLGFICELNSTSTNTIPATDILTVTNELKMYDGYYININTGTIDVLGNIVLANTAAGGSGGGSATIRIKGVGDQTFTGTSATGQGRLCNVTIDKPSGVLSLIGKITIGASEWKYINGTVDPGTSQVTFFGNGFVNCGTTSLNMSFYDFYVQSGNVNLTGLLNVKNDITIASARNLYANTYDVIVGRNFGGAGLFTPGTSTVTFNGTGRQVLNLNTLYKTVINKPSGKAYLTNPLLVNNSLTLTNGIIATTTTNVLKLADNATSTTGSNTSYVAGPLTKIGNDAFTFAVGDTTLPDSSAYHPFSMTAPANAGDIYIAQYFAKNQLTDHPTFTSVASTLKPISTCEYWSLTRNTGSATTTPTLGWNKNTCNINALADVRVASWSGSQWTDLGQNAVTGGQTVGTIKANTAGPNATNQYYAIAEKKPTVIPNQRYWVGNNSNKDWNNNNNWSDVSGGQPGASYPVSTDAVFFDNGGTGDLILNVNIDVKQITIASNFSKTIQQNGKIMLIGVNGFTMNGGTFLGDNANITVNGPFTLTGGTFRSTSKKLTIVGNYLHSTGTFTHNSGQVSFTTTNTISGKTIFNNLTLEPSVVDAEFTLSATDTITVDSNFVYAGTTAIAIQGGTINIKGDIHNTNTGQLSNIGSGNGWLNICGSNNQLFKGKQNVTNRYIAAYPNIKIDKTGGTLTLQDEIDVFTHYSGNFYWMYVKGNVDPGNSTVGLIGGDGRINTINGSNSMSFNHLYLSGGYSHQETDIKIKGDLTIYYQQHYTNGHNVELGGNLINSGSLYMGTSDMFTFNGTGNQTLMGNTPYGVFNKIKVSKPSGKLFLNYYLELASDFILEKGIVIGSTEKYIQLGNGGSFVGGSSQSYVMGALRKAYYLSGDINFPVGDTTADSAYHPIVIPYPSSYNTYQVQYFAKNVTTDHSTFTPKDGSLGSISSCEYWSVTRMQGTATVLPTLRWANNACAVSPLSNMRVAGWDGTTWKNMGQSNLTGTASGTIKAIEPALTNDAQYYTLATFSSFERYWVGNGSNKDWNNNANWSYASGGSGGAAFPTSTDLAFFDNGGSGDLILNVDVDVKQITVGSNYSGTIQQNGKTMLIGVNGLTMNGGTFLGDNANITVNGPYTLTGGTFRSTSKKLAIVGNYLHSAGTFTHNSGQVSFNKTNTITGKTIFNNLTLEPTVFDAEFTLSATDTITVDSNFVYAGTTAIAIQGGTINIKGDINNTNTGQLSNIGSGNGWLNITGNKNQLFKGKTNVTNRFIAAYPNIRIDKTGGTLTLQDEIDVFTHYSGNFYWLYVKGNVDAGNSTVGLIGADGHVNSINGSNSMTFNHLLLHAGYSHQDTDIKVKGDLTILSHQHFTNGHNVELGGNLINSGSIYTVTNDMFTFNGTGNQTLMGNTPYGVFSKIKINKPSGKVFLNYYLELSSDLILEKGIVVGSTANYIEVANNGAIIGGSNQSYVMGALRKKAFLSGDINFPVGDTTGDSTYHPIVIPYPSGYNTYQAQYFPKNVTTDHSTFTPFANTLKSVSDCEYWSVTRIQGTGTIVPTLGWNANSCNIHAFADVRVAGWDGSTWTDLGQNAITGNTTIGTIKAQTAGPDLETQYYVLAEAKAKKPIAAFHAVNVPTQSPLAEWTKTFGGSGFDNIADVVQNDDGDYFFFGATTSSASGDVTGTNHGSYDYWIGKVNSVGSLVWSKAVGSSGTDLSYGGIVADDDGGCTVVGQAGSGTGDFSDLTGSGPNDLVLVKLDANGSIVWKKLIGGNASEIAMHLLHLKNGGLLIVGHSNSATGTISGANNGDEDGFVIKTDNQGNVVWTKIIGTSGFDYVGCAVELESGEIMVGGTLTTGGTEDFLLAKLSSTGTLIWQKTFGGSNDDDVYGIAKVADGFVLTGYTLSNDGDVGPNNGGINSWTVKTDVSGNLIWKSVFGGSSRDQCRALLSSPEGGSIGFGQTNSQDFGITTSNNSTDGLLIKYNSTGQIEWHQQYGSAFEEVFTNAASTYDGGFIIATSYAATSGEVAPGRGNNDGLLMKLKEPVFTTCLNNSITFNNTSINGISYLWKVNNVDVGTDANLTYSFNTVGTYTVSLVATNGSLTSTKNSIVMVSGVSADAGPALTTAPNIGITIGGTPVATGGIAPYTYSWTPITGLNSSTIANPVSTLSVTTTYTVLVSDASGCTATGTVLITIDDFKPYAVLKRELDGGYFEIIDGLLRFRFDEEYNDLDGKLLFRLYDNLHKLLLNTKNAPSLTWNTSQYGANFYSISLAACYDHVPFSTGYYTIEVENEKKEVWMIRLKNTVTGSGPACQIINPDPGE